MELHVLKLAANVLAPEIIKEYQKTQLPTLRDQFAIATINGLWASPDMSGVLEAITKSNDDFSREEAMKIMAEIAYQQADAMLVVRQKPAE